MPHYRRNFLPGGLFFFTVVTDGRRPILGSEHAVGQLREAVRETKQRHPFDLIASVILPDHLHMIWALPAGDAHFDRRWSGIKANFSRAWLASGGEEQSVSAGRRRDRRRGVWQPRFIEHTLRDESDLQQHVDYIHWNPVKHGYVDHPVEWPYSSIHRYLRRGWLPKKWVDTPPNGDVAEDLLEP